MLWISNENKIYRLRCALKNLKRKQIIWKCSNHSVVVYFLINKLFSFNFRRRNRNGTRGRVSLNNLVNTYYMYNDQSIEWFIVCLYGLQLMGQLFMLLDSPHYKYCAENDGYIIPIFFLKQTILPLPYIFFSFDHLHFYQVPTLSLFSFKRMFTC